MKDLMSLVAICKTDIDSLGIKYGIVTNKKADLERVKIIAADGPSDYMRKELNAMDEEVFNLFIQYHLATCERPELLGASSHTVDILRNVTK